MNRLDAMTLFIRVADLGSFAAAASQLGWRARPSPARSPRWRRTWA
ncbi:hypothetical protein [Thauera phenolivorans]|nr:hypothetical protein [Thauera phenolivorans]